MRKIIAFGILCFSLVLNSCSEKIDLIGDFKETAVIYGLLNQADTLHYVKITNKPALGYRSKNNRLGRLKFLSFA